MTKKRKLTLFVSLFTAGGIILIIALIVILWLPFRNRLPDLPDLQSLSEPLQEQIANASKKARLFPTSDNLGNLGMVYHSSAFYDKAAQCYLLAVRKNKSKWLWSYYLGYLNQEMGESDNAIENFRNVIRENPAVYHAWYYVGEGYRNMGSDFKAEVAYQKITHRPEKSVPGETTTRNDYFSLSTYAMFQLSRIYMNSGRFELAEKTLKQILQSRRSFGPAYRLLASVYRRKGDSTLTSYNMLRANDLADFTPPVDTLIDKLALLSKSELYILKQIDIAERSIYPEWALAVASNGLKYLPENKYLISKAIKLFFKLDLGQRALPYLEKHISLFKDDFSEIMELADLLYDKGYISQSLIYYNLAVNLKPDDPKAQSGLAFCLSDGGMHQNAIDQFTDFIEKNISNKEVIKEAVFFFMLAKEREKAVLYLEQLRRLSSSDPAVKKFEGMIAEVDGKPEVAVSSYQSSFFADPTDLSTIRYLGNLLMKQGKWDKSVNHYRKALEYHPNEPDLLERLGTMLASCPEVSLRDYKAAMEFSERAFINKSSPPEILISSAKSLAEAYWGLGDKTNASSFMNVAISLARHQNAPKEFITELENRLKLFNPGN